MSNMSYCRFENTSNDLRDCKDALSEMVDGEHGKLSDRELQAAKHLAATCLEILTMLADNMPYDIAELADRTDPKTDIGRFLEELNGNLDEG
jgi:hypothetical protein